MPEYFLIAKIVSVYGKSGYVKISSYSDFPDRFYSLKKAYIDFFGDKKLFFIEKIEKVKDFFIVKFKNFNSEKEAGVLAGKEIFVDDDGLVKLPEGFAFYHDLIGSTVLRNNVEIGKIIDVLDLPANNVYVINDKHGKEILIPAVADFIDKFDAEKKVLYLNPDKDLYEDDED